MSKFLFMSNSGDGLGLAWLLKNAGNDVAAFVREGRARQNLDRMILKFSDQKGWQSWLDKDTTVVFDSNGGGPLADRLRQQGHHVFMGSKFCDTLELDRDAGFEFMKQVEIKMPRTEGFFDWNAGKKFVLGNKDSRWVFKPSGALAKNDAIGSYVASDPQDMCDMMDMWATLHSGPVEYVLQEFLEGVCISTEGWFNGEDWMYPFNHTVERKQVMNDNLGPSGGCAGNAVWGWFYGSNHIIEEGIKLMGPILREFNYVGPIDLNTVVNEDGVFALEFTPRFGYDALPAILKLVEGGVGAFGELMASMARGEKPKEMPLKRGYGTALRVSVPPYPSEEFRHAGGVPIRGWEKKDREDLFFYGVKLDVKGRFVTAPDDGAIAAIMGYGMELEEAFNQPKYLAGRAKIPEKQYRTDIVKVLDNDIARFDRLIQIHKTNNPEVGGNK